jgi:hypothetical protein
LKKNRIPENFLKKFFITWVDDFFYKGNFEIFLLLFLIFYIFAGRFGRAFLSAYTWALGRYRPWAAVASTPHDATRPVESSQGLLGRWNVSVSGLRQKASITLY